MKKNILLAGLVAVAALSSCENEDTYTAAPLETNPTAYFANTLPSTINASSVESSYDVIINRASTEGSLDVALTVTNPDGLFSVPSSVSFAAGEAEAKITISYDLETVGFDNFSTITIAVDQALASIYGIAEYTFTIGIPAPWKSLGNGIIVDDFVTTFYGVENLAWEVEIQENELYPGYYRVKNPYCENYPYNDPGDWDTANDFYLEIHAEDPNKVYIPVQVSNTAWSYGNFIFGSLAGYYLAKGDEESASAYYGTLAGGIITFPANALLFGMSDYNDGGLYTSNSNGAFKLVLPGVVLADYSAEVAYAGKMYDVDDNLYIVASATLGADVEELQLAVCAAGEEAATAAAIAEGSLESVVALSASGTINVPFDADAASGKYSIVGVTFANGEAQEAATVTFKYTSLGGEPAETWTAYYVGTSTYSVLFSEPETDDACQLLASDDDPSGERCKIAPWINNEEGLIFSWPEEGDIEVLGDQETGLAASGNDIYVAGMTAECSLAPGATWAEIVNANFGSYLTGDEDTPSYLDGSTFNFNVIYYTAAGSVYGWGFDSFMVTGYASAPAARSVEQKASVVNKFAERPLVLKSYVRRDAVRAF